MFALCDFGGAYIVCAARGACHICSMFHEQSNGVLVLALRPPTAWIVLPVGFPMECVVLPMGYHSISYEMHCPSPGIRWDFSQNFLWYALCPHGTSHWMHVDMVVPIELPIGRHMGGHMGASHGASLGRRPMALALSCGTFHRMPYNFPWEFLRAGMWELSPST